MSKLYDRVAYRMNRLNKWSWGNSWGKPRSTTQYIVLWVILAGMMVLLLLSDG